MKPVQMTTYVDSQLPVVLQPPIANIVLGVVLVIGGLGFIAFGGVILFEYDDQFGGILLFAGLGLLTLLAAAQALTTKVCLNPTTLVYRNVFGEKTLTIRDIVSITKWQSGSGWILKILSSNEKSAGAKRRVLLIGYLAFSTAQILSIEKFLRDRQTSLGGADVHGHAANTTMEGDACP